MKARVLAAAVALVGLTACASGSGSSSAPATTPSSGTKPLPGPGGTYKAPPATIPVPGYGVTMSTAPAPWPPPAVVDHGKQSAAYVAAAGLPYGEEVTKVHYHAHLDVIIDGTHEPVPAYLGFVAKGNQAVGLSALHTHDGRGVIHVENAVPATFLLGQLFTEWGVRFTSTCVGAYCTGNGKELAVFVNGARYNGDPTQIVLAKHQEIAVLYGDAGKLPPAPKSFSFSNGE